MTEFEKGRRAGLRKARAIAAKVHKECKAIAVATHGKENVNGDYPAGKAYAASQILGMLNIEIAKHGLRCSHPQPSEARSGA